MTKGVWSAMMREYFVYILASRARVLYTGVTNNVDARVVEHSRGGMGSFTGRYKVTRLVYLESFSDIREAITREKQIKGWVRSKKVSLIESMNPEWKDLSDEPGLLGPDIAGRIWTS